MLAEQRLCAGSFGFGGITGERCWEMSVGCGLNAVNRESKRLLLQAQIVTSGWKPRVGDSCVCVGVLRLVVSVWKIRQQGERCVPGVALEWSMCSVTEVTA